MVTKPASFSCTSALLRKVAMRIMAILALMRLKITDGRNARGNRSSVNSASDVYALTGVSSFPPTAHHDTLVRCTVGPLIFVAL